MARRKLSEIQEAAGEYLDRVWYVRHQSLAAEITDGTVTIVDVYQPGKHQTTVTREIWDGALASARRCERQYGKDTLGPLDDWDYGRISGVLETLRWVMGDDWGSLDT
jgi:hypothetical protein